MLPISLTQQFSVWIVYCWPRTWLGRWSIGEQTANPKSQPPPLTVMWGILPFVLLPQEEGAFFSLRYYLEIPAFPAGVTPPFCVWMECVAPTAWPLPDRSWEDILYSAVRAPPVTCVSDPAVPQPCALGEVLMFPLQVKPSGSCHNPWMFCMSPPWLSPALEPGAPRGCNCVSTISSPAHELSVGVCRRTVAFGKGLAGEGCCGCWVECWLAHLGLHCLPCRPRGALAAPGSAGWAMTREWRYFKLLNEKVNCHCPMGC